MTITVTVETRGHPALVKLTLDGKDTEITIGDHDIRAFHIDKVHSIDVREVEPTAEEPKTNPRPFVGEPVPGAAENDELMKPLFPKPTDENKTSPPDQAAAAMGIDSNLTE